MSVFTVNPKSHLERRMFFDGSPDVARYDQVKYPQFAKYTDLMLSLFWRPQEVVLTKDKIDFGKLSPHEQFIFTSNIKRQIMLDSIQGRGPMAALGPALSLPELETCIEFWQAFEQIHSLTYTHIIRNIYPNPTPVFDGLTEIQPILTAADSISHYYDLAIASTRQRRPSRAAYYDLWLLLHAINALEGIRFYVSFACSWAFAELGKMEGNAKLIKLIARDENIHLGISTAIIKALPKDDPIFAEVAVETKAETQAIFINAIEQEKAWADYIMQDGSMIGLNAGMLKTYAEWIGTKRMRTLGIDSPYSPGRANPLPWTERWISGSNVQVAPQEVEFGDYKDGGAIVMDDFHGFLDAQNVV